MSHKSDVDRARIRTEIAREVASELVSDLKSQHDLFRSLFYTLFASDVVIFVALLFSYRGDVITTLWMMFAGSVIYGRIEIAAPVYAKILILVLFQFFGYDSTETIVLTYAVAENSLEYCSIDDVKRELCEGFSFVSGQGIVRCLESNAEIRTAGEPRSIVIRCRCKSIRKRGREGNVDHARCECKYRPSGSRWWRMKLNIYLTIGVREDPPLHLLTITLRSSPLTLFMGFIEDFITWNLRVYLCKSRTCKKAEKLCKWFCRGLEAEEFIEISTWYELREDLFLALQDTLGRLEACRLYVCHIV